MPLLSVGWGVCLGLGDLTSPWLGVCLGLGGFDVPLVGGYALVIFFGGYALVGGFDLGCMNWIGGFCIRSGFGGFVCLC
jgi:hypothetical protein